MGWHCLTDWKVGRQRVPSALLTAVFGPRAERTAPA